MISQRDKKEGSMMNQAPMTVKFCMVKRPDSYQQSVKDIVSNVTPFQFADMVQGGITPDHVHSFHSNEEDAVKEAIKILSELYNRAKALEEKKSEVSEKLQKRINDLQKMAEGHMKSMKTDPQNADQHHMKAEGYMTRIKELREKHKSVEGSKKIVEDMDYEESGLKNPKEADRNKDKKISKYEKTVGQEIEKSMQNKKK